MSAEANTRWGRLVIAELRALGVPCFCLAPGARCAPLSAAIAETDAPSCVFTDERGAAFFALGVARATGRPAAVITTSGTAVANLGPAVAEADASRVPLLLLTADRPPELRGTGANQTIDQLGLFGSHVRWRSDFPCPDPELPTSALRRIIDHAYARSLFPPPGPVHLNLMFREPLGPVPGLPWGDAEAGPACRSAIPQLSPSPGDLSAIAELLSGVRRGILVAGSLETAAERAGARALADALGWPIFADVTSGLRAGALLPFDYLLASPAFAAAAAPDAILHVGGPVVSKRYLQWIEQRPPRDHVLLRPDFDRYDPAHTATLRAPAHLAAAAPLLIPQLAPAIDRGWRDRLERAAAAAQGAIDASLAAEEGLTEPAIARIVSGIPAPLFLGNSMPIRDADLFAPAWRDGRPVAANRGVSGIDGLIASAAGWALGQGAPSLALVGDLSALHDLSSLPLLAAADPPLHLVVVNNGGGGIFSFLPLAQSPGFERCFAAAHPWGFRPLAAAFGLPYAAPRDGAALEAALAAALSDRRGHLIEVTTERAANRRVHARLLEAAAAAAASSLERDE